MSLTQKRWLLLAAACFICFAAGSIYAWSVFAGPMAEHLSAVSGTTLTGADLAIVFAVANGIGPIPMILGGAVTDRFGPRMVIVTGGLLIGTGMFASGFVQSLPMLVVSYGLVFGLGLGLTYGCVINNILKFFPDHRGMVGGLTTAVYGGCSVVLPPIAEAVNSAFGVTTSFKLFGIVFGAIILAGSFLSVKCPQGFVPEGMAEKSQAASVASVDMDWRQMVKTPLFWAMLALLLSGAVSGMMILSQAAGIARSQVGLSGASAAACVSLLALANVTGRLLAGTGSDRFGRLSVLASALLIQIGSLCALMVASEISVAPFYAGLVGIGLSFGAFMGVFPGFTADSFGTSHNAVNYGIMFCGFSAAGLIGPQIMRLMREAGQSYAACYCAALMVAAAGLLCILLCRSSARKATQKSRKTSNSC